MSDLTIDMRKNEVEIHDNRTEDWRITFVDTGDKSMTGGEAQEVRAFFRRWRRLFHIWGWTS